MGIILLFLGLSLFIGWWSYAWTDSTSKAVKRDNFLGGAVLSWVILSIFSLVIIAISYGGYVQIRTMYEATINQYKEAVTMYVNSAVINVEDAAMTDFKYQGYQGNVAEFIKDLRVKVVEYNETLIGKRIMKSNFMFSWLIVAPDDDMKILRLSDSSGDL